MAFVLLDCWYQSSLQVSTWLHRDYLWNWYWQLFPKSMFQWNLHWSSWRLSLLVLSVLQCTVDNCWNIHLLSNRERIVRTSTIRVHLLRVWTTETAPIYPIHTIALVLLCTLERAVRLTWQNPVAIHRVLMVVHAIQPLATTGFIVAVLQDIMVSDVRTQL